MTRGGAVAPGSSPLSPRLLGDSLTEWRSGVCREKNRQTPGRHPSPLLPRGSHLMDFPVSPDGKWKKLTCEWLRHKSAHSPFRGATEWRPGDGRNCADGVLGQAGLVVCGIIIIIINFFFFFSCLTGEFFVLDGRKTRSRTARTATVKCGQVKPHKMRVIALESP